MPGTFDIETEARKILASKGQSESIDFQNVLRLIEILFPDIRGNDHLYQKILAAMLYQGVYTTKSIGEAIDKKSHTISDVLSINKFGRVLEKAGLPAKLFLTPVPKNQIPANLINGINHKDRVYMLPKEELKYVLFGRIAPLATEVGIAINLSSSLLANLERMYGGYINSSETLAASPVPNFPDTYLLGVWFNLTEKTEKEICLVLREASIFEEHPALFSVFELAVKRGVELKVVITKVSKPEISLKLKKIGAIIKFVTEQNLKDTGFEKIRIAIHDKNHLIYLQNIGGIRSATYVTRGQNDIVTNAYIDAFDRLWKIEIYD